MDPSLVTVESLAAHLRKFERQNLFWRITVIVIIALVILFVAFWFLEEQGKLETQNFTLVDHSGKQRAVLGLSADGSPSLVFYDQDGKILVLLTTRADGSSGLEIYDRDKRMLFKAP